MKQIAPTTLAPAIIALILFSISALWHLVLMCKHRQKFFIPFFIGTLFQVVGYIFRIVYYEGNALMPYIIETLVILLAPILYAASIYGLLEKLIVYTKAESTIPVRPSRITCIFLSGDILAFIMQSTGGGMQASAANTGDTSKSDMGAHIVVLGLAIQLIFFFFFLVLTALFHIRTKQKVQESRQGDWKLLLKVLEFSSLLLLIRALYRIIEYAQGFDGYLIQHEVYFFIFDTIMMLLTQLCYNVVYPGKILIQKEDNKEDAIEGVKIHPTGKVDEPEKYQPKFMNQDLERNVRT